MSEAINYIHPGAKIASGVKLDGFVSIYEDVVIEEGAWIGSHVSIMPGARIGKNCRLFPGAVIASPGNDDIGKAHGSPSVVIGESTTIRECVTVSRGSDENHCTYIGSNVLIMAYAHVAANSRVGDHCILVNSVQLSSNVTVHDYAIVGGASAVSESVKIGAHVMVSGGSMVTKDIPPYTKAGREPVVYSGINSIGLRRRGFTSEQINRIQEVYRRLYLSGLNTREAVDKIEKEIPDSMEKESILSFISESVRGIISVSKNFTINQNQ